MSGTLNTTNNLNTYLSLITSEHAGRPDFVAFVTAIINPLISSQQFYQSLLTTFDLDTAIGVQLDAVGQWIGASRKVTTALSGVYFSFDTSGLGWDQGNWQGPFDATTGLTSLDDDTFRLLLQAKVILNSWNGTITVAATALSKLFASSPGTTVTIQDNQDMTMTVTITGQVPSAVLLALLEGDYIPFRPEGVLINYSVTSVDGNALFGWDTSNSTVMGWDTGAWSGQAGSGTAPGQVTGLSYTSLLSTSVVLSWVAPTSGTGPFNYQVQYQQGSGGSTWILYGSSVSSTQETVTGLSASTTYTFTVYAVNGTGAGSNSSPLTIMTAGGVPGQVTGLQITGSTTTSVSLSWNAITGSGITYQVQYEPSGGSFSNFGSAITTTTTTVTGLSAGQTYVFQVYALNQYGSGATSPTVSGAPSGSGTTPGVVQNLTVVSVAETSVSLAWNQPTTSNGPYTYTVQFAQDVNPVSYSNFTGTVTSTGTGGTATVTGLNAGQEYLFTVTAANSSGNGTVSSPVTATTGTSAPSASTALIASSTSSTGTTLSWNSVTGASTYQVQVAYIYSPNSFTNQGSATSSTTSAITGLTAGTGYVFQVLALNSSGTSGPPSPPVAVVTTGVTPSQTTGLTIGTVTNSSVALSWTAPVSGTGIPVYQVQYQYPSLTGWINYGVPISATSQTVSNLQPGQSYNFQVYAINDFGNGTVSSTVNTSTTSSTSSISWNSNDSTSSVIFSNNNLTVLAKTPQVTSVTRVSATSSSLNISWTAPNSSGFFGVRGTQSVSGGKVYIEFVLTESSTDFAVGVANSSWNLTTQTSPYIALGNNNNSLGIYPNSSG